MSKILPEANIGLVGHVDHGKSTVVQALTGKWTAVHSEELKRGITIKLGYADLTIHKCPKCKNPDSWTTQDTCPNCKSKTKVVRMISFVDAPGHETLMAVMMSGAAIMDGAILVIAANEECPQPQTREHLMALNALDIKNIIIVQNKVDLVKREEAIKNYNLIKEYSTKILGFEPIVIPISAQQKVNIDLLLEAIEELVKTPKRDLKAAAEMFVARSFDVNKPGTEIEKLKGGVIGGAITKGIFKVEQDIEIRPGREVKEHDRSNWVPIKTKIVSIMCGDTLIKDKGPGGSVAISTVLDPYLTKGDSLVGSIVGIPEKMPETRNQLIIEPHLFDKVIGTKKEVEVEPIKINEPLLVSSGTATTLGVVSKVGDKVTLNLRRPVCASKGSKVSIGRQIMNKWRLIGYGIIS